MPSLRKSNDVILERSEESRSFRCFIGVQSINTLPRIVKIHFDAFFLKTAMGAKGANKKKKEEVEYVALLTPGAFGQFCKLTPELSLYPRKKER